MRLVKYKIIKEHLFLGDCGNGAGLVESGRGGGNGKGSGAGKVRTEISMYEIKDNKQRRVIKK